MSNQHNLIQTDFAQQLLADANKLIPLEENEIKRIIEEEYDPEVDEFVFYVQRVGFSLFQLIEFIEHLLFVNEYIGNYKYPLSKNSRPNRVDHLFYNIENYYIRLASVSDRILQLINNVFHLCIDEKNVSQQIITNLKVKRTHVPEVFKKIEKVSGIKKVLETK